MVARVSLIVLKAVSDTLFQARVFLLVLEGVSNAFRACKLLA